MYANGVASHSLIVYMLSFSREASFILSDGLCKLYDIGLPLSTFISSPGDTILTRTIQRMYLIYIYNTHDGPEKKHETFLNYQQDIFIKQ